MLANQGSGFLSEIEVFSFGTFSYITLESGKTMY